MPGPSARSAIDIPAGVGVDNPALMQLLGLCPLLAVSTSAVTGAGLGLATLATLVMTTAVVSLGRNLIAPDVRLPVFVLVIATVVSAIDILGAGWFYDLHLRLGLFVPLIVTNCVILARLEVHASKQPLRHALVGAWWAGLGFALALVLLGAGRELLGTGCVLAGAELLFAEASARAGLCLAQRGVVFALLPPGAFIALALLVVLWRGLFVPRAGEPTTNAHRPEGSSG